MCICASVGYILVINRPLGSIVKQQEPQPSGLGAYYLTIEPRLVYNYYILNRSSQLYLCFLLNATINVRYTLLDTHNE